jgi:hypothetical protein
MKFGTLALHERRILHWRSTDKGGQELAARLPGGRVAWMGIDERNTAWAVMMPARRGAPAYVVSEEIGSGRWSARPIQAKLTPHEAGVFMADGAICLIQNDRMIAIDAETGAVRATRALPGHAFRHRGRCFLTAEGRWFAASFTAGHLEADYLGMGVKSAIAVFERSPARGLWAMATEGDCWPVGEPRVGRPKGYAPLGVLALLGVSPDGDSAVVRRETTGPDNCALIRIGAQGRTTFLPRSDATDHFRQFVAPRLTWRTMAPRFVGVRRCADGALGLVSRHGATWAVRIEAEKNQMRLVLSAGATGDGPVRAFSRMKISLPSGGRVPLREIDCDQGRHLFLDRRRLLHFKSRAAGEADLTLVLCQPGPMAGWSFPDRRFGDPYFLPGEPNADPTEFATMIRRFAEGLA